MDLGKATLDNLRHGLGGRVWDFRFWCMRQEWTDWEVLDVIEVVWDEDPKIIEWRREYEDEAYEGRSIANIKRRYLEKGIYDALKVE